MKRRPEVDAPEHAQAQALRDTFIMRMNQLLRTREMRHTLAILPMANFSRLVRINADHMCWKDPDRVFKAAGVSQVQMNTEAVMSWINEWSSRYLEPLDPSLNMAPLSLSTVFEELFVKHVKFVPWKTFTGRFTLVVEQTVERIKRLRESDPRRITLLMLGRFGVSKSNAWLTGYAWPMLAQVVDYVVSNGLAATNFFAASRASDGFFQTVLRTVGEFLRLLPPRTASPRIEVANEPGFLEFLSQFEVDVIYVDDMVYSGSQATESIFTAMAYHKEHVTFASRIHVHFVTPYIAPLGLERLTYEMDASGVADIDFAPGMVTVPEYRTLIDPVLARLRCYQLQGTVARVRRNDVAADSSDAMDDYDSNDDDDMNGSNADDDGDRLSRIVDDMEISPLPAIVFEHKLADGVSLPLWLIRTDFFQIGMPKLVLDPEFPFYKTLAMRWRDDKAREVDDFGTIHALVAAAHLRWLAGHDL